MKDQNIASASAGCMQTYIHENEEIMMSNVHNHIMPSTTTKKSPIACYKTNKKRISAFQPIRNLASPVHAHNVRRYALL